MPQCHFVHHRFKMDLPGIKAIIGWPPTAKFKPNQEKNLSIYVYDFRLYLTENSSVVQ